MLRNRLGQEIDREQAEALTKDDGLEVRQDVFVYDGQKIVIRSMLQPVCHGLDEPAFLTLVMGDVELGMQELPTTNEDECRSLHGSLVDRYLLLERNRQRGVSKALIKGVL